MITPIDKMGNRVYNKEMEELFYTDREVAEILKIKLRHVRRMVTYGALKAKDVSLGTGARKMLRILKSSVMDLDRRKIKKFKEQVWC